MTLQQIIDLSKIFLAVEQGRPITGTRQQWRRALVAINTHTIVMNYEQDQEYLSIICLLNRSVTDEYKINYNFYPSCKCNIASDFISNRDKKQAFKKMQRIYNRRYTILTRISRITHIKKHNHQSKLSAKLY